MFFPQNGLPAWSVVDKANQYRAQEYTKGLIVAVMNTQNSYVVTTDETFLNPKFYAWKNDKQIGEFDTFGEAIFNCEKLALKEK